MSVPLDRLYYFISSRANAIRKGDVVIYRFLPHGSKKVEDLDWLHDYDSLLSKTSPEIYCYDQEPLDYDRYQNTGYYCGRYPRGFADILKKNQAQVAQHNLRSDITNIYDRALLLHSERGSVEVGKYQRDQFIPVYYWSHAVIARDWYRFAEHVDFSKNSNTKTFLIYNRAWSGTREYRLQFSSHLINLALDQDCLTSCNPIDPETGTHYKDHAWINLAWNPTNPIEKYFPPTTAESYSSADFDIWDYKNTDIEVVLETLFDDVRLYLTEKILRPIACRQPFIVASTPGSLEYLRSYGFKTFNNVWDENYDSEENPERRLHSITKLMKSITEWDPTTRKCKMALAQEIADFNQQRFFSKEFSDQVVDELDNNLNIALNELEKTNTSRVFFRNREVTMAVPELKEFVTQALTPQDLLDLMSKAESYFIKSQT